MSEITYKATYSGHVDGEKVAWTFRAYNEEGAPYVLVLGSGNDVSTIVQAPTEFLDGVAAEDRDRENAINWVHHLTELADKAKAYDEIFDALEEAEREECGPNGSFVVDELTESETDSEWVDKMGDHYKYIDGQWYGSLLGPWHPASAFGLTDYGPYTAVDA